MVIGIMALGISKWVWAVKNKRSESGLQNPEKSFMVIFLPSG